MDVPTMMDIFVSYGYETDDEMTDQRKLEALNETYWEICSREDWPFLEVKDTLTVGTDGLLTATGGAEIGSVSAIWDNVSTRVLQPIRLDDLFQRQPDWASTPGDPLFYYFVGDSLYLAPVPSNTSSLSMNIQFQRIPAELTALSTEGDILIPKRYHRNVLVIGTLSKLAIMQDDPDTASNFERLFEKALQLMVGDIFNRQTDRPDFIHVYDVDNYDYS